MQDATFVSNYLMNKPPYSNYKNYFNVYALKVISQESGVKHPGTASDVTEPVIPSQTQPIILILLMILPEHIAASTKHDQSDSNFGRKHS
jgi:hypothetical protein